MKTAAAATVEKPKLVTSPAVRSARSASIAFSHPTIEPPFCGTAVVNRVFPDEIVGYLDEASLHGEQWGLGSGASAGEAAYRSRISDMLGELLLVAQKQELFAPRVVHGYFPANSDGNDVVIWDDEIRVSERARIPFVRQSGPPHLCAADYVKPVGEPDFYPATSPITTGDPCERARCGCSGSALRCGKL
jgi:5-methyltetrahydrofolate--homocysteine methyltransferase